MRFTTPRSWIRRDGLKRVLLSGWAAAPRKDWELMLTRYSPDVVWGIPEEFHALGFAESYHGHQGLREGFEQFAETFESWEIRPERAMDFGDRVLALGEFQRQGAGQRRGNAAGVLPAGHAPEGAGGPRSVLLLVGARAPGRGARP